MFTFRIDLLFLKRFSLNYLMEKFISSVCRPQVEFTIKSMSFGTLLQFSDSLDIFNAFIFQIYYNIYQMFDSSKDILFRLLLLRQTFSKDVN